MNSLAFLCVGLAGSIATVFADSTDRVIIAAMKLSEQPNYSWFSVIAGTSSRHEIDGRTTTAGITWARLPMVASIGRQLGRQRETHLEALFQGNTAALVFIDNQWRTLSELPLGHERAHSNRARPMVRGSANAGNFGMAGGGHAISAAAPLFGDKRNHAFDGPHLGVTHPHEELAVIVSSFSSMEVKDDMATGTLSPIGAALLLVRAEQTDVEPIRAGGTFKLWLRAGAVTKYHLDLEGEVTVGGWKRLDVRRTSTTTLSNVGTTDVSVPDDARRKLLAEGRAL